MNYSKRQQVSPLRRSKRNHPMPYQYGPPARHAVQRTDAGRLGAGDTGDKSIPLVKTV